MNIVPLAGFQGEINISACTALGKSMLAQRSDTEIRQYCRDVELKPFTVHCQLCRRPASEELPPGAGGHLQNTANQV